MVEISNNGGGKSFVDTSCTHEVKEGMEIQTKSARIIRARKMLAELLVTSAPNVKMAQDIAARMGLAQSQIPYGRQSLYSLWSLHPYVLRTDGWEGPRIRWKRNGQKSQHAL